MSHLSTENCFPITVETGTISVILFVIFSLITSSDVEEYAKKIASWLHVGIDAYVPS